MELKKQRYKTEPAFCELLGISGDHYEDLVQYGIEEGIITTYCSDFYRLRTNLK
ncbi:DUF4269 domain-containing protein [Halobacillus shinanisalinarum]|uniref:DUF4269 domain-containing protein n=1 Tax=Halobacillus shinanisalinarum TaxID=2932258 RepID=A0ABY4H626_9BACI|nr:DUF4269 domain-containing protein [Halobacillus shinanisalinarum]